MRRCFNVGSLLAHRLRRRPNSKPAFVQRFLSAGKSASVTQAQRRCILQTMSGVVIQLQMGNLLSPQYVGQAWTENNDY